MIEYRNYRLTFGKYNMVEITNLGKGMVPISLRGTFTNYGFAKQAVDAHLDAKGYKDANTDSGS